MKNEFTLIIGNGFDLNLGLHTSYRSFRQSDFWPQNDSFKKSNLGIFLNSKTATASWFDLEDILCTYGTSSNPNEIGYYDAWKTNENDYNAYCLLVNGLCEYITKEEAAKINEHSSACTFISKILMRYKFDNIFSFNYTNWNQLKIPNVHLINMDVNYVHGSCEDKNIILGVSDEFKMRSGYDFLYKTSHPFYCSSNIRYALQRSSLIIFWGHSLGKQDYHYFSNFFQKQCRENIEEKDGKTIIFITKDEWSRQDILLKLRRMNDVKINLLYDCNRILFLTDELWRQNQYDEVLLRILSSEKKIQAQQELCEFIKTVP